MKRSVDVLGNDNDRSTIDASIYPASTPTMRSSKQAAGGGTIVCVRPVTNCPTASSCESHKQNPRKNAPAMVKPAAAPTAREPNTSGRLAFSNTLLWWFVVVVVWCVVGLGVGTNPPKAKKNGNETNGSRHLRALVFT